MNELLKPVVWPEIDSSGEPNAFLAWPNLYEDLATGRRERWEFICRGYEQNPDDFYNAWMWVHHHPIFWYFAPRRRHESTLCWERGTDEGLEFRVVKTDPETKRIEDDEERNTLTQVWVEVFPSSLKDDGRDGRLHDYLCDTGGDTYEEAVIEVAREIYGRHGNDRVKLTEDWSGA